jgi:hypothetical protein
LRTAPRAISTGSGSGLYEGLLGFLRRTPTFTAVVIGLTLISAAGVLWYYKFNGPTGLRFVFDYNYFLYFLILHVTFSFNPRSRRVEAGPRSMAGV